MKAWPQARQSLFNAARSALLPLQNTVSESTEVDCSLSGYAHLLPVVPVLADLSGYSVPMASTIRSYRAPTVATEELSVVVSPGDMDTYLKLAIEDSEFVTHAFGLTDAVVLSDPSKAEILDAIARSRFSLLALHGVSAGSPGSTEILSGRDTVSIVDILGSDLSASELIVFAACESAAPDQQVYKNPLSISSAAVYAGARAATGSMWRTPDKQASLFTRSLFSSLIEGCSIRLAYVKALKAIASEFELIPDFSLVQALPMSQSDTTN